MRFALTARVPAPLSELWAFGRHGRLALVEAYKKGGGRVPHTYTVRILQPADARTLRIVAAGPVTGVLYKLFWSDDGRRFLLSTDHQTFECDATSGRVVARHPWTMIAEDPRARVCITGVAATYNSTVTLRRLAPPWTAIATVRVPRHCEAQVGMPLECAFAPRGERLAVAGAGACELILLVNWRVAQRRLLGARDTEVVDTPCEFAPSGRVLVIYDLTGAKFCAYDCATGKLLVRVPSRRNSVVSGCFTRDGRFFIGMSDNDNSITAWRVATWRVCAVMRLKQVMPTLVGAYGVGTGLVIGTFARDTLLAELQSSSPAAPAR
ncbi:MAG: hypothetical protein KGJ62_13960 [Armatimonadetes bacterium]|nr:hypothetical protein [Armatimonadota bacterium]MDE2206810.1 hypothetical protein [Armatimonadota bacterium]